MSDEEDDDDSVHTHRAAANKENHACTLFAAIDDQEEDDEDSAAAPSGMGDVEADDSSAVMLSRLAVHSTSTPKKCSFGSLNRRHA